MEQKTPRIIDPGEGLRLHPATVDDAEELYAAIDRNRPYLRQWLPWLSDHYVFDDTLQFLRAKAHENERGDALTMVIRLKGVLCGAIELHRIDRAHRMSSIGYWIDPAHSGFGIVTRSCKAIAELGFRYYGLHRIEIRCATGNSKSAAIATRVGFFEEGTLRQAEWLYDHWIDLRVFSMLEHEL